MSSADDIFETTSDVSRTESQISYGNRVSQFGFTDMFGQTGRRDDTFNNPGAAASSTVENSSGRVELNRRQNADGNQRVGKKGKGGNKQQRAAQQQN